MQNRKIHRAMAFASKIAFACFALIRATYAPEPGDTKIPGKTTGSVSFRQGAAYPVRGW